MIKPNQWYKLTEREFTDILRLISPHIRNTEEYIESLNRVGNAFTNNKVLYLKLSRPSIRNHLSWHYRTSYSDFFSGPCLEYKDIMFDAVNGYSEVGKRTFIAEHDNIKYELELYTWYEVNEKEYTDIICGLPSQIRRDVFNDEIEYGRRAAKNRPQIYIMFDYYREVDDEHCRLNVSKTAPSKYTKPTKFIAATSKYKIVDDIIVRSGDLIHWEDNNGAHTSTVHDSDGKRIKDSAFADDNIIEIVRDGKIIYGPRSFPTMDDNFDAMWYADWNATKENKENKEKKVMEDNKIQAIRSIINKYKDDAELELNCQYEEQDKEVRVKDLNVIALRQYVEVLNKNRKENTEPYNANTFNEIYTAETKIKLDKLYDTLMDKKRALREQCDEVLNLCMLCDTYEQMRQVLADYEIIPNTKKRGK